MRVLRQNKVLLIILVLIILGIFSLAAGVFLVKSTWRAVFLTNNQVYFGHFLYNPFRSTVVLTDIYYLQINQSLQAPGQNQGQLKEVKVVKFGNEIHGPKDKMVILKSQILFWEDLRSDSSVVKAITEEKSQRK